MIYDTPPKWISNDAKKEFMRISGLLADTLSELDYSLVCDYCQATSDVKKLTQQIRDSGTILINEETGASKVHPDVVLITSKYALLAKLRTDLCLTPKSRRAIPHGNKKTTAEDLLK